MVFFAPAKARRGREEPWRGSDAAGLRCLANEEVGGSGIAEKRELASSKRRRRREKE